MKLGFGMGLPFLARPRGDAPEPPVLDPLPSTSLSTFAFGGETFALSAARDVGFYEMGEPVVLNDGGVTFTQTGTASAGGERGVMLNPYLRVDPTQGFSSRLATLSSTTARSAYSAALNLDQAVSGNLVVADDTSTTLVKAVPADPQSGAWINFQDFVPVTVVAADEWPNDGDFRPGMSAPSKAAIFNVADIDLACLRSIDMTGAGLPSYASILAIWKTALPHFGQGGDPLRAYQTMPDAALTGYTSDLGGFLLGPTLAHLHSDALSGAEKLALAKFVVQAACEPIGAWQAGYPGGVGAGQHQFYYGLMAAAAALTNKAVARNAFNGTRTNLDQAVWITEAEIGLSTVTYAGNQGGKRQKIYPFTFEDLGRAAWVNETSVNAGAGVLVDRLHMPLVDVSYRPVSSRCRVPVVFGIALMLANRSMPNGVALLANGGAEDNTAPRSAAIHLVDDDVTLEGLGSTFIQAPAWAITLWKRHRALIPTAPRPQYPLVVLNDTITAGANQISWAHAADVAAQRYSRSAITQVHLHVSQDNYQFERFAVDATGSRAAPGGIPHFAAISFENATGIGRRSPTLKRYLEDSTAPGNVTPTGTPTGTVEFTHAPRMLVPEYLSNTTVNYYVDPDPDGIPAGVPIWMGAGLATGAISGDATIQVQREATLDAEDWGNISGDQLYAQVPADLGKRLRHSVTRNSVTAFSAPHLILPLEPLPDDVWTETEFGFDYRIRYPLSFASLYSNSGATVAHVPGQAWDVPATAEDVTYDGPLPGPGGIIGTKTSTFPRISVNLTADRLPSAGTYRVSTILPVGWLDPASWSHDGTFNIRRTATSDDYVSAVPLLRAGQPRYELIERDITVLAGETIWVSCLVNTNIGLTGGGRPHIAWARVVKLT